MKPFTNVNEQINYLYRYSELQYKYLSDAENLVNIDYQFYFLRALVLRELLKLNNDKNGR